MINYIKHITFYIFTKFFQKQIVTRQEDGEKVYRLDLALRKKDFEIGLW